MSISLSIQNTQLGPENAREVPIATHEVFRNDWAPASLALGLIWIPLFEQGLPVSGDDLKDILAELHKLDSWLAANRPEVAARIAHRIGGLISTLEALESVESMEIYIG